jgi:hypothetical protein
MDGLFFNRRKDLIMSKKKYILIVAVAVLFVSIQVVEIWQIISLRNRMANEEWSSAFMSKAQDNEITPDVGTIQFLKSGYSIELVNVNYTNEGLKLKGFVGNPLNLSLSNLTLKFRVTKPLYKYRDEFQKNEFTFLFGPEPIGEAQTSPIAYLLPKSKEPFEVTIPNVKQMKDGLRLVVNFTGERYSY